ncbi:MULTISPECIES: Fe-S cluster assembly sulfur transfer protein SufU [unclassified Enterococcus]|uniref:Fe-S cluster assembly sulfur transfer protein SufU n=1 Tax=unclassified Enterococcus TaxID=2608891 RepID=UPI001555CA88|nr:MULTISPECIES: SUF system NifU family Fe-S cluster assembly protein [unclassified Enterococcus]MBS7577091.1 SUF system NifU family Fe-S cluster assembly protein [Enterococcus sp. MMGLQ5-2]MBS7584462.1 SUF system NifU family Fe-S cluster assembly protein [Enterococcus sp. MMGLQ5-1]NPD12317.1 SUF system NifU family Fe-S cluster assembly protein [Enterococcus sp. MMGLQ5-1]NPD36925.1 SUF system NifU family Fe-S cluster assembly protein [Enterococcus sp. MMGLQ5-2]
MALTKLDSLYRAVILDHSAHPHHHGTLEGATPLILNNPTCGDVIHLSVEVADGRIKDIAFDGSGCSISTASASMMTDAVLGKTIEEVAELSEAFSELVQGQAVENTDALGDAAFLSGVSKFPARIKCATLSWNALKKALESEDNTGTSGLTCH